MGFGDFFKKASANIGKELAKHKNKDCRGRVSPACFIFE